MNFKVVVSSYALASILNTTRVFFPYRRRNGGDRSESNNRVRANDGDRSARTQRPRFQRREPTVSVGEVVSYASSQNAPTRSYANAVGRGQGSYRGGHRGPRGPREPREPQGLQSEQTVQHESALGGDSASAEAKSE